MVVFRMMSGLGIVRTEHHPLPPPPSTSVNWELLTASQQVSIGAEDAVSTWKAVVPPPFLSLSLSLPQSLSSSLPPFAFVADGELTLLCRRSPSLSIIPSFLPPSLFALVCALQSAGNEHSVQMGSS